VTCLAWMEFS